MPYISSKYPGPPLILRNGTVETIYAALWRKAPEVSYQRERRELPDGDFIDLDWLLQGSNKLAVIVHGLEGNSQRPYLRAMASLYYEKGWDVLAWNARSCSGEMNRNFRLYSHADIDDLQLVLNGILHSGTYKSVTLTGVSMGGNMVLKYAGVEGESLRHSPLVAVTAISTPLDLRAAARNLDRPNMFVFNWKFSQNLKKKITAKANQFPGKLDLDKLDQLENWEDFDRYFTVPLGGYENVQEFYKLGSGINYLSGISVPTLIINAQNDPILTEESIDFKVPRGQDEVYVELPKYGGHVAFTLKNSIYNWSEIRSWSFAEAHL
ncbi:MAG TPA: alpha/beta fold hydrolase [Saprospiraceae bacterium]|nr:alpha/beta fold hydrolase [Saprospiraceae bacterium]